MSRSKKRNSIENKVYGLIELSPFIYGGNKATNVVKHMFHEEFGILLTDEQIKFIASVDRARRRVLKSNPELDNRTRVKELQKEDAKHYAKTKNKRML